MDAPLTPENVIFVVFAASGGLAQPGGAGEIDRDELRDAAFGHRDAEQAVDARHRDAVMRDQQEPRAGGVGDLADESAETVDIGVVERRVDLVEDADRRGVRQKNREDQCECRQRLLPTRSQ